MDWLRANLSNDEFVRWYVYYSIKAQMEELERLKAEQGQRG